MLKKVGNHILFFLCIVLFVIFAFLISNLFSKTAAVEPDKEKISSETVHSSGPTVIVGVANYVSSENIKCYLYTAENMGGIPIVRLEIGLESNSDLTELSSLPRGWTVDPEVGGAVHNQSFPTTVRAFTAEESDRYYMTTNPFRVNAGKARSFSVCMQSDWDQTYKTSHWIAHFLDGSSESGQLVDNGSF